jgi:CYTH domain-containing protein
MTAGREVERKYLVTRTPADLEDWDAEPIEQGYLAITDDVEVRVRRRAGRATLTIKSAPALVRVEEELELDERAFTTLWPLTEGRRVTKRRHVREAGPLVLELDVYDGALEGLMTLEVELPDPAAAEDFAPPSWVGRDVTGDARYSNQALARFGRP